jgi:hypothetical protein
VLNRSDVPLRNGNMRKKARTLEAEGRLAPGVLPHMTASLPLR